MVALGTIEVPVGASRQLSTTPYREGARCVGRRVLRGALSRLEPGAGKLARRVLRGGASRKAHPLPDYAPSLRSPWRAAEARVRSRRARSVLAVAGPLGSKLSRAAGANAKTDGGVRQRFLHFLATMMWLAGRNCPSWRRTWMAPDFCADLGGWGAVELPRPLASRAAISWRRCAGVIAADGTGFDGVHGLKTR